MEEDTQKEQTSVESKPEAKSKLNPMLMVGLIVVVVLIVGGVLLFGGQEQSPAQTSVPATQEVPATPGSDVEEMVVSEEAAVIREMTVEGDEYSFSPSTITLVAGERVRLVFNNIGNLPHNLTVQGLGIATRTIGAGQAGSIEFTPETSGTITFYCSVGNHRAQGMEGELTVE